MCKKKLSSQRSYFSKNLKEITNSELNRVGGTNAKFNEKITL
jgi:hypothetical protein